MLPSLEEYDAFLENLWQIKDYRDYIINYLMRYHYTRNKDLVDKKKQIYSLIKLAIICSSIGANCVWCTLGTLTKRHARMRKNLWKSSLRGL